MDGFGAFEDTVRPVIPIVTLNTSGKVMVFQQIADSVRAEAITRGMPLSIFANCAL
jgi:hypothetical protein